MHPELARPSVLIRSLIGAAALAVALSIGLSLDALASKSYHETLAAAQPAASTVMVAQASVRP